MLKNTEFVMFKQIYVSADRDAVKAKKDEKKINRHLCNTTENTKEKVLKFVKSEWSCVKLSASHIEDLCEPHTSMQSRKGGQPGCFCPEILSLIQLYKYLGYF